VLVTDPIFAQALELEEIYDGRNILPASAAFEPSPIAPVNVADLAIFSSLPAQAG
jgi:hypothetical protein